jgi:hypothetical protein
MKTTLFPLCLCLLLCAGKAFAQNFTFADELKQRYIIAKDLEKKINTSSDGLREIKVKRDAHPLDKLLDRHFCFLPTDIDYRVYIFFCKNDANAKRYGKRVFSKKKDGIWAVKDGVLIVVAGADKTKDKLAYFIK